MSYTPGPWTLTEGPTWPFEISIGAGGEEVVFMRRYAYGTTDKSLEDVMTGQAFDYAERPEVVEANARQIANARLIAAAPDMLAMLQHTAKIFREYERMHREKDTVDGDHKADRNMHSALAIEAVIEQATGAA